MTFFLILVIAGGVAAPPSSQVVEFIGRAACEYALDAAVSLRPDSVKGACVPKGSGLESTRADVEGWLGKGKH